MLLLYRMSMEDMVFTAYTYAIVANASSWKIWLGKIEKRFSIFELRLGINFSHFRLGRFWKVGSRLGSPEAGVEIDTG